MDSAVSQYNTDLYVGREVRLVDCTLRDGEQQPGLVFSKDDKVRIARQLDELGISEIEAGTPAVSTEDFKAICEIVQEGLEAKISALARATKDDIQLVKETGAWGIRISLPVSPLQLKYKLGKTEQEVRDMALFATTAAKESGLYVIFSPYDTARSELSFLLSLIGDLKQRGLIDRVRLVDTVGSATPATIGFLARAMKGVLREIPIEVHCHDDFGLALASSIEAVLNGCEYISCTMNGLGSRCGNTALEEIAVALETLYGIHTGINLKNIYKTAQLVEHLSSIPIHPHKSIIGKNAFTHETGLTVSGVLKNPFTAEAYDPELVGQKRHFLLGKKSGMASIKAALGNLEVVVSDEHLPFILEDVKNFSISQKRDLTTDEFVSIVKRYKKEI